MRGHLAKYNKCAQAFKHTDAATHSHTGTNTQAQTHTHTHTSVRAPKHTAGGRLLQDSAGGRCACARAELKGEWGQGGVREHAVLLTQNASSV